MSVRAAADALAAAETDVAPVADASARCVGLFTASDYRRCLTASPAQDKFSDDSAASTDDRVCDHMARQFATTGQGADIRELLHRLSEAIDPFLVVLDREHRPVGVVCGLDVLIAETDSFRFGHCRHSLHRTTD
jgi:CBS-domain-containing membrane protein